MPLYSGKGIDLLIEAINRDNPKLTWKLDTVNYIYSKPQPYTVANQLMHNTQVRITAKESSPYRGNVIVTYRRLDLTILFRSQRLELFKFIAAGKTIAKKEYLELINIRYGLNLEDALITGGSLNGNLQTQTVVLTANEVLGYQYIGKISLIWKQDLEELGLDVMLTSELAGAVWPGGRSYFDPEVTYPLRNEFLPLYRDYTEDSVLYSWPATNTSSNFVLGTSNSYGLSTLLLELSVAYGLNINMNDYHVTDNPTGVKGYSLSYRISPITTALKTTYPFLNREGVTHVALAWITGHPQFGVAQMGYMPFYFNV